VEEMPSSEIEEPRRAMKTLFSRLIATLLVAQAAGAQPYTIDWHKISGGGGASTNAHCSITGTIGQPDATDVLSGATYSVTGGFWSIFAVQTAGAPTLGILGTNGAVMVYWPSPSTGFSLQANTNLSPGTWTNPVEPVQDTGAIKYILVNPPVSTRFFRLVKPVSGP
jgi:hypothetical protein